MINSQLLKIIRVLIIIKLKLNTLKMNIANNLQTIKSQNSQIIIEYLIAYKHRQPILENNFKHKNKLFKKKKNNNNKFKIIKTNRNLI